MQVFVKPVSIAYSWPATDSMNIAFCEQYEGGNVLEVQVDVKQAKQLIQQLTEFCERKGALPAPSSGENYNDLGEETDKD